MLSSARECIHQMADFRCCRQAVRLRLGPASAVTHEIRRGNEPFEEAPHIRSRRTDRMTQLAAAIKSKYATENLFGVNQNLRPAVTTV
jgi:hypothetical protein